MSAVLVVADDEEVRHFIEQVLLRNGFAVESVSDAVAAANRLARSRYDALVLDSIDASAVLHYLESSARSLIAKTVVATTRPRDAASAALRDIGRVIVKPFDARGLLEAVAECVAAA